MKLSENFSLAEMIRSQSAIKHKIDNTPSEDHLENLKRLCEEVLEPIRELINQPMRVTSGYRSPALNKIVGGSKTSQHSQGLACDFVVDGADLLAIAKLIAESEIPYDQLIAEDFDGTNIRWIHVSGGVDKTRRQILTMSKVKGKAHYQNGLPSPTHI